MTKTASIYAAQILLGLIAMAAGYAKLTGTGLMVQQFHLLGISQDGSKNTLTVAQSGNANEVHASQDGNTVSGTIAINQNQSNGLGNLANAAQQGGTGSTTNLTQVGASNWSTTTQSGDSSTITLTQSGTSNTITPSTQTASNSGVIISQNNTAEAFPGFEYNMASFSQAGTGDHISLSQTGASSAYVSQTGANNDD